MILDQNRRFTFVCDRKSYEKPFFEIHSKIPHLSDVEVKCRGIFCLVSAFFMPRRVLPVDMSLKLRRSHGWKIVKEELPFP